MFSFQVISYKAYLNLGSFLQFLKIFIFFSSMFMTKTIYHHNVHPQILTQVLKHSITDIKNHPTLEGETSEIPFSYF